MFVFFFTKKMGSTDFSIFPNLCGERGTASIQTVKKYKINMFMQKYNKINTL